MSVVSSIDNHYSDLLNQITSGARVLVTKNLKYRVIEQINGSLEIITSQKETVYSTNDSKDHGNLYIIGDLLIRLKLSYDHLRICHIFDFHKSCPINGVRNIMVNDTILFNYHVQNNKIYLIGDSRDDTKYVITTIDLLKNDLVEKKINKETLPQYSNESILHVADDTVWLIHNDNYNYYLKQIDLETMLCKEQRLMNRSPGLNTVTFHYHNKNRFYVIINSTINTQDENGRLRNYIKPPFSNDIVIHYLNANGSLICQGSSESYRFDNRSFSRDYRDHIFKYPYSQIERFIPEFSYLPIIKHLREIGAIIDIHRYHEIHLPRLPFDKILLDYLLSVYPAADYRLVNLLINFFQHPGSIPNLHQAIVDRN